MKPLARLAVAMAVIGVACSSPVSTEEGYDLTEYAISGPARASAGGSTLLVSNSGEFPHTLVIADQTGTVVAATNLIQPGSAVQLEVDLPAGTYQFTCRIVAQRPDGEIVDHFEEGMRETVVVEG